MDETLTVKCDGKNNENELGHPIIYINVAPNSITVCPYCGKEFSYEQSGS